MEAWVRFSAQSQARERLLRAAQYACALAGAALSRSGGGPGTLSRLEELEGHLSLGRKLLRLGGSAEALGGAQRALHLPDPVLRFCLTLAHLNRALFLACDNVLWAAKSGALPGLDSHKWGQRAFRYYLFALVVNLSRDMYELRALLERAEGPARRGRGPDSPDSLGGTAGRARLRLRAVLRVLRDNPPLLLDLLRNICDLPIPLERLGMWRCGRGVVGMCGLASSLLSIVTILHPWLRLKP